MIGGTESRGSSIELVGAHAGHSSEESRVAKAWVLWFSAFLFAPEVASRLQISKE